MTAVDILKILHQHGEEVRADNFAKIFDEKSIAFLYKVLDYEYKYSELSTVRESTLPVSNASNQLSSAYRSLLRTSEPREKDPEKKEILKKISHLVTSSIASIREKEVQASILGLPCKEEDDVDDWELDQEFNSSQESPLVCNKHIQDNFLDERKLGLKIEKVEEFNEFSLPDFVSGRDSTQIYPSVTRKMFDITATLNDLKQEELRRLVQIYSSATLSLTLIADFQVLLSCLFGKEEAQKHVEHWVHVRTSEWFNQVAEDKVAKKKTKNPRQAESIEPSVGLGLGKTEVEMKVEEMKKMVKEFFIKLD